MANKEEKQDTELERSEQVDDLLSDIVGEKDFKESDKKKKDESDDDPDNLEEKDKEEDDEEEKDDAEKEEGDDEEEDEEDSDDEGEEEDEDVDVDDEDKGKKKDKKGKEDLLQEEINTLKETINSMLKPPKKKDVNKDTDDFEDEKPPVKKGEDIVFIKEKDLPEDTSFGEEDVKFLNKFANDVRRATLKESLVSTAKVVTRHVSEQSQLSDLRRDFYEDNPDLKEVKPFVGYRVAKLAEENPDWGYKKLFSELGNDVRSKLAIRKEAVKLETKRKGKPAFPGKQKTRAKVTSKNKLSGTAKEIDDLI